MTARATAVAGRHFAEQQMVDECTITRDGAAVLNTTTGLLETEDALEVYDGPCRLRTPTAQESETLFGEESVTMSRYVIDLPHTVRGVRIDDVVTMTESEDSDVEALRLRVVAATAETIYVMKSYACEAVT